MTLWSGNPATVRRTGSAYGGMHNVAQYQRFPTMPGIYQPGAPGAGVGGPAPTGGVGTEPNMQGGYSTPWGAPYGQFGDLPTNTAPAAAASYWRPAEFQRAATPYPGQSAGPMYGQNGRLLTNGTGMTNADKAAAKRMAGMGGGGGYAMTGMYIPPEHSLGPGAYWPGHSAERRKQLADSFLSPANAAALGNTAALHAMQAAQRANGNRPVANWGAIFGGGGGGGSFNGGGLAGAYQSANDRAKAENEARYRDILNGMQQRYERNMEMLRGQGAQEGRDINEAYAKQGANINQNLISRGLGNSTITGVMAMGNERERLADQGRLQERLRNQQLAADAQLSGDVLSFMERRTDEYPDYNQLAQLAQMLGQAGYGQPNIAAMGADYAGSGYVNPMMFMGMPMGGGFAGGGGGGGGGMTLRDLRFMAENAAKNRAAAGRAISGADWSRMLLRNAEAARARAADAAATGFAGMGMGVIPDWHGITGAYSGGGYDPSGFFGQLPLAAF